MAATYVYRMDDIAPGMDWERFYRHIDLFRRYGVRPLLGVVPDNRDDKLDPGPREPRFWEILRELLNEGAVELAQHGFQHRYVSEHAGLWGPRYGFSAKSEFAGLPLEEQRAAIERGRAIMREQGCASDVWMAPSHTFDRNTLTALAECGFRGVTDGIALYPFDLAGLRFVPQQLWGPKQLSHGVWTICLHPNVPDDRLFAAIERHLQQGARVVPFSEAVSRSPRIHDRLANALFRVAYRAHIARHKKKAGS
jgi:predicted deacetylase